MTRGQLVSCPVVYSRNVAGSGIFAVWACSPMLSQHRRCTMARRGRPTAVIELSDTERETLQRWVRRHSSAQALALRSRIVLA